MPKNNTTVQWSEITMSLWDSMDDDEEKIVSAREILKAQQEGKLFPYHWINTVIRRLPKMKAFIEKKPGYENVLLVTKCVWHPLEKGRVSFIKEPPRNAEEAKQCIAGYPGCVLPSFGLLLSTKRDCPYTQAQRTLMLRQSSPKEGKVVVNSARDVKLDRMSTERALVIIKELQNRKAIIQSAENDLKRAILIKEQMELQFFNIKPISKDSIIVPPILPDDN